MHDPLDPEYLRELYSLYEDKSKFEHVIERVRAVVVASRYSNGDMTAIPEPFERELYGKSPPIRWRIFNLKLSRYDQRHGINADGQVCLITNEQHQWIVNQTPTLVEQIGVETKRYELDSNANLIAYHMLRAERGLSKHYTWAGDTLKTVLITCWNHQPIKTRQIDWKKIEIKRFCILQSYIYDNNGLIQIIDQYLDDSGNVNKEIGDTVQYARKPNWLRRMLKVFGYSGNLVAG